MSFSPSRSERCEIKKPPACVNYTPIIRCLRRRALMDGYDFYFYSKM